MKTRILMLLGLLMLCITPILAQVEPPADWQDLYDNFPALMLTYVGVAAIASFLGEFVIRWFQVGKKFWKVVLVWLVAIGLSFLGNVINLGYLAEATWYQTLLWGCVSGALAGGLRAENVLFIKTLVEFVLNYIAVKKEPSEE